MRNCLPIALTLSLNECQSSFNIEIKHKISFKIAITQVKNRFQINVSTNVNDQMHYMQES